MSDFEPTTSGSATPRAGGSVLEEIARWLLLLPVAAGAAILGISARGMLKLLLPADMTVSDLAGFTIQAFGYGLAVYLSAKVAPRGGRWIAIALAIVFVGNEGISLLFRRRNSPPYEVATTLFASGTAAWLFWSHGRSGFRGRWRWILAALPAVIAILFFALALPSAAARWAAGGGPVSRFSKHFRSDGISFRYPPEWELTVGEWKAEGGYSSRELDLDRWGAEGLSIWLYRPPVDEDPAKFFRAFHPPDSKPVSPVTETATVIAGRRVAGARRDYSATYHGKRANMRVEVFYLRGRDQTIRVTTMADVKSWSLMENRFRLFFEQFTFE